MVYLFLDLETTGLPETAGWGKYYHFKDVNKYSNSRILSICIYLYSEQGQYIDKLYYYIQPEDYRDILQENKIKKQEIHGITENMIKEKGKKWEDVIKEIQSLFQDSTLVIGHNVNFDIHILCSELFQNGYIDLAYHVFNKDRFCTMESGKDITKIKGKYNDYKYPKLSELYQHLFNEEMKGAHNAEWDVINCAKCFFKIMNLND